MEKSLLWFVVLVLAWTSRGSAAPGLQVPDFCNLFPDDGLEVSCLMYLPQFFFNSTSQQCEEFIYGGCGGNDNRFSSKKLCLETCDPRPALFAREVEIPQSIAIGGCVSPRTHSRKGNACSQPPEPGPCVGYFPQYFYNETSRKCEIFIYGGCRGNRNRFDSIASCLMQCRAAPVLNATEVCSLAPETGPCRAAFPSLYFNPQSQRCEPFIYGGCDGNDNRFDSIKDCMRLCHPEGSDVVIPLIPEPKGKPSVCALPPETGRCREDLPRFFFNSTSQQCEKFTYGGCGGNENKFVSKRKCNLMCHHVDQQELQQQSQTFGTDSTDICSLQSTTGPCKAHIPRFYFNQNTKKCEEFVYGGCGGNKNNFVDEAECVKSCKKD